MPSPTYPKIIPQPLEESASLHGHGTTGRSTVLDYWRWAYSDLIDNASRGIFAEWLVAQALGLALATPRSGWDNVDLHYRGQGIEVKSCAYHQAWAQERLSTITFNVRKSQGWDPDTNKVDPEKKRRADIYILCLFQEQDRSALDPLDTDQWRFWAIPTCFFNRRLRSQHSIGLAALQKEVGQGVSFAELQASVDKLLPPCN